ncbi:uncharacterized protein A1O9_06350 [Exophiala aquamarina CBS 119918]|uniref:NAD(P)-binding domain-containing protein n=1 Tax=Exophiala aquamarina CBS 119918 TaxID=1182545 RepID=A0A072PEA5_9EURO|nr:uncharacterized protein A1O9_06350 [Exophiala aquamarina CBS 119918]KEF58424.1 hypothetical protein A1O9_06350 [Exophiala aquamarina CBS 119918]
MIKVAIVGTNGLAQYIANSIATTTSHQFVMLSRRPSPGLQARGWQVMQVDYSNASDLRFKLAGVDTVISTISGNPQIALIDAAASAHVRRFVPSEFSGPPSLRPPNDILDNGRRAAILRLHQLESTGMRFTVFSCGIFYERFAPGGMASSQIGLHSPVGREGDYLMDFRNGRAQIPFQTTSTTPASICMTSARDVARFLVEALDLPSWPREFRLRGERMNVREVIAIAEQVRGRAFEISGHTRSSLQDALTYARAVGDQSREIRMHHLIATAEGRFDFVNTNLNQLVSFRPEGFREWLVRSWSSGA